MSAVAMGILRIPNYYSVYEYNTTHYSHCQGQDFVFFIYCGGLHGYLFQARRRRIMTARKKPPDSGGFFLKVHVEQSIVLS